MSQKTYVLNANSREISNRKAIKTLKDESKIPGIVYGKDFAPVSVSFKLTDFEKVLKEAKTSSIVDLLIDEEKHLDVLCHDIQTDYAGRIIHADFYKIDKNQELEAEIQLEFIGEAPAKKAGFTVLLQLDSISVKCLPKDLVSSIQVDLSKLEKVDDEIKVSDLNISKSIKVFNNLDDIVAIVHEAEELDTKVDNTDERLTAAQAEEAKKAEEASENKEGTNETKEKGEDK